MKLQTALLNASRRQVPRLVDRGVDAAEKYHGMANALISWINNRRVGIGLDLPLGEGIPSDWIRADEKSRNDWNVALPDNISSNDSCSRRIEAPRGRYLRRLIGWLWLGNIFSATANHDR